MRKNAKRIMAALVVAVMLACMVVPVSANEASTVTYGERVELQANQVSADNPIVIDGQKDTAYGPEYDVNSNKNIPVSGKVSFAWDSTHLYVYLKVIDPSLNNTAKNAWDNDRIRVLLDLSNKQTEYTAENDIARRNEGGANYVFDAVPKEVVESGVGTTDDKDFATGYRFDDMARTENGSKTPFFKGGSSLWANLYKPYIKYSIKPLSGDSFQGANGYIYEFALPCTAYVTGQLGFMPRNESVQAVEFKVGHVIGASIEVRDESTKQMTYVNDITKDITMDDEELLKKVQNTENNPRAYGCNIKLIGECPNHTTENPKFVDLGDGTHKAVTSCCNSDISSIAPEAHSGGTSTCEHPKECEKCGAEYGDKIDCDFSRKNPVKKYLVSEATTEAPAVYYYACTMCGEKGTETYEHGEKLAADSESDTADVQVSDTAEATESTADTSPEAEKGGCAGTVAGSMFIVAAAICTAVGVSTVKKKED